MPNYLIGALLETQSTPEFITQTLKENISKRRGALPIGMVAPLSFQVEFNSRKPKDFGNRRDWLCPYYDQDQQNCGVWKYRSAVCNSFFCKSSYGKEGLRFWSELSDFLTYVEMALLEDVLVHLDFSPRQLSENLEYLNRFEATKTEMKSLGLAKPKSIQLWNGYFEEQVAFFVKSYKMVATFDRPRFLEAIGEQGRELEDRLLQLGKEMIS